MELGECEGIQVVLTGGVLRRNSFELCGPLAGKIFESIPINIEKMFMGIDGITPEYGITTFSEWEAVMARQMLICSKQTFAVFDHSKVGITSLFNIASISSLTGVITNKMENEPLQTCLMKLEKELLLADLSIH